MRFNSALAIPKVLQLQCRYFYFLYQEFIRPLYVSLKLTQVFLWPLSFTGLAVLLARPHELSLKQLEVFVQHVGEIVI